MVQKKSTTSKAKAQTLHSEENAQPIGESAPLTPPATTLEPVTAFELESLQMFREIRKGVRQEKAERNARVEAVAAKLKAIESDDDLDKALDFIERITNQGGQYLEIKGNADKYLFHRLALHLATSLWMDWFDIDTLYDGDGTAEEDETANLTILAPYINDRIWEAFNRGMVDENSVVNWINSLSARHHSHVEWVDERGVQIWLGSKSKATRLKHIPQAEQEATATE